MKNDLARRNSLRVSVREGKTCQMVVGKGGSLAKAAKALRKGRSERWERCREDLANKGGEHGIYPNRWGKPDASRGTHGKGKGPWASNDGVGGGENIKV